MKKLVLEFYSLKRNTQANIKKGLSEFIYDFSKPVFKEYHFIDKTNEQIKDFMTTLQTYNVVYIYKWEIKEA